MSRLTPMLPDAMPLREALRGLRHVLRKGGESLKDTMSVDTLPQPAARLAGVVLREVEAMVKGVDDAASGLVKKVLGGPGVSTPTLDEFAGNLDGDAAFAAAFYTATQAVLKRLGANGVFISEASARKAFQRADLQTGPDAVSAAALTIALHDARVLKGTAEQGARVAQSDIAPVALFAVMLWLQSLRAETEDEAALVSATDLSVALANDISTACSDRNYAGLAALYAEFTRHV